MVSELVGCDTTKLNYHQFPKTLTGFRSAYILRGVDVQEIASEWLRFAFVLALIGFLRVLSQKLEAIVSSGRKDSPILFPCAFRSPYSSTYLHRLFCGMCASDHMHTVDQMRCSRWVLYTVRVGWHHSVLYQGFVQIAGQSLH